MILENYTKHFFFLFFFRVRGFDNPIGLFISIDRAILNTIDPLDSFSLGR
jgi:hypothetical protein